MTSSYYTLFLKIIQLYTLLEFFCFIYITFKLSIFSNHTKYYKDISNYYILFILIVNRNNNLDIEYKSIT